MRSFVLIVAFFGAAFCLIATGFIVRGRTHFAPTQLDEAIAQDTRIIAARDANPSQRLLARLYRAQAYLVRGEPDAAIADYQSIIRTAPANSSFSRYAYAGLISVDRYKHDDAAAMAAWKTATAGRKLTAGDFVVRGELYTETGDYPHAEADLDAAEQVLPAFIPVHVARYRLFMAEGNHEKAMAALDRIQQLAPYYPGVHSLRAWLYLRDLDLVDAWHEFAKQGDMIQAQQQLVVVARRIPEEEASLSMDAVIADCTTILAARPGAWHYRLVRGEMYSWKGDLPDALVDLKAVQRDQPVTSNLLEALGAAYFGAGNYQMAAVEYRSGRAFTERKWPFYREHGTAEFALGDYRDAAADYVAALAENPGDAYSVIWLHLARMRMHADDKQEFAKNAASLEINKWPEPIVEYMQGKLDETALTAMANNGSTPATLRDQNCEEDYYTGILALDRGDKTKGLDDLRSAARSCHPAFFERTMANLALKQAHPG